MNAVDARLLLHSLGKLNYNRAFLRDPNADVQIKNINVDSMIKEAMSNNTKSVWKDELYKLN